MVTGAVCRPVQPAGCERSPEADPVRQRLVAEGQVDGSHRGVVLVVAGVEGLEAVLDGPGDGGPLERGGNPATAVRSPDRGHVVVGDGRAAGRVAQARVSHHLAGRLVEGKEERVPRDPDALHVARGERLERPDIDRLVLRGNVGERLEGRRMDSGDEIRARRQGRDPDPVGCPDLGCREAGEVQPDHLRAVGLDEATVGEELVPGLVGHRQLRVEPGLAGGPGRIAERRVERRSDAAPARLERHPDPQPEAGIVALVHPDPAGARGADGRAVRRLRQEVAGLAAVGRDLPAHVLERVGVLGCHGVPDPDVGRERRLVLWVDAAHDHPARLGHR